ncbi:MAG: hypothetical protein GY940_20305 [bacterium]|nr:hypothetical protein [bacterium]
MKTLIKILILMVILYMSYTIVAQSQPSQESNAAPQTQEENQEKDLSITEDDTQDPDDDDFLSYDQDIATRKVHQKYLSPLSRKDKIIWSFRLAKTNSFL